MRKLLSLVGGLAIAGAAMLGTTAVRADGYEKAKGKAFYEPVPYYNWGGLYVGGSAGGAWGNVDANYITPVDGGYGNEVSGAIFGIHVGIQHQWNALVFGLEMSYSGSAWDKIDGRGPDSVTFPAFDTYSRVNSVFTLGPRLGWAVSPHWLLYATGGYASAHIFDTDIFRPTGIPSANSPNRQRHDGYFIGGGVEYALTRNVILGLEYQHLELEDRVHSPASPAIFGVTRRIDGDMDIVRARLSFKLNRPEPVHEPLK